MRPELQALAAATTLFIATAARADCPVNFTCRDAKGSVYDVHFDGKSWQALQLNNGGMTGAPAALGDPSAFAVGPASSFSLASPRWILPDGHRDFSYVGEHGDIHHIYFQKGQWAWETLNNAGITSAPAAAGAIAATAFNFRQLTYTYRDPQGNIQHLASLEGHWQAHRLNHGGRTSAPLAAGDPAVLEREPGNLEVVYRDAAGGIQHLGWAGGGWKAEQLNLGGATGAPAAEGQPSLLHFRDERLHCAFRDRDGNLHHLARRGSSWVHDQVTRGGRTAAPPAAGDPAGTVRPDGQLDYVYRDTESGLQHLSLKDGRWQSEPLKARSAGDPWIRWARGDEAVHVFYRDGQDNLQHLSGEGKWSREGEALGTPPAMAMAAPVGRLQFY